MPQGQGVYQLLIPPERRPLTELGLLFTVTPNHDFTYPALAPTRHPRTKPQMPLRLLPLCRNQFHCNLFSGTGAYLSDFEVPI